jgi:alpha-D-ribose 1-methylphosphonate 5-triphosphate synthase subunit PhnH
MSDLLRLGGLDPSAAAPAGFAHAEPESRGTFLTRALLAGGTLVVGGVAVAGLPKLAASAPSPAQDVEILNLALLLEYLEVAFFTEASVKAKLTGELLEYAEIVRGHERAHVAFLRDALGKKARKEPTFDFGDATREPEAFTTAAVQLQDLIVGAYNVTTGALEAAAKIVSVEARHAGWIRAIAGENPAPSATEEPKTAAQATAALNKTKYVKSS